ncbi:TPA: ORF6N domain-containing protein [Enterobacter hormaechei subsp. xiangfangensis]|uniref:Antirepressor n=1 Tax=Enterobacter hormaechei subsp. xiangfangensis TaxID=1296536 RepID=A0A837FBK4_9ENTR|nr:ORF6N domain-containing protein [Enterobacter hormaechei]KJM66134.1 antirepressor [Enterobacter hormaechei subsp. xiangfangensis]HAS1806027.1 ORF6N domain-containing protein [Enterobacter hormaechei subsp. xiangfangensis]HAS1823266.1 ORF6N domain-containing protein [Enterobacter hormaechei subsp. xiangfangensis]HAS1828544.1 ORF6N domain-containing protein [Enterobacter hormaechei subsp. xiangfangensis]HAS1864209.1 ORF6N domain-containing protein [Enterobacter hormaechei subsp. xiangfangensi
MAMKTELAPVAARDLQIIEYRGQRVVTTEQLAAGYGTDEVNIRKNLSRNLERFEEGKHYFLLTGSELKGFKNLVPESHLVNKHTSQLILWTERGAARMSKVVDTDQAWGYHEDLVEFYFTQRDAIAAPSTQVALSRKQLAMMVIEAEERAEATALENKTLSVTVENLEKHFTKGMTLPAFGKALNGVNTSKITWWAYQRGWIYNEQPDPEKEPRWRVKSYARDKYLTEQDIQIKDVGKEPFTKKKIVLLQKGTHRIYQLYLKGELPMKTTWNGEFSHDKAIYTPEEK